MKRTWILLTVATAMAALPAMAAAQARVSWQKGTALAVFGGAAHADDATDPAAGTTASWELTPYFTLEGSALWTAGAELDTFTALAVNRINVVARRPVVPFVTAGVGVHRATIAANARPPAAYARRLAALVGDGPRREETFDDFAASAGGGVELYVRRHLSLRPDVRVLLVRGDGRTRALAVYGVHLAYHFEEHPITPQRTR